MQNTLILSPALPHPTSKGYGGFLLYSQEPLVLCPITVVHIYNGILLSHKKDEMFPFVTTKVDPEGIMLSKISQMEKVNIK